MTNLNFEVDQEVHASLKIIAIRKAKKMEVFLNDIFREYIKDNAELLKVTEKVDTDEPHNIE